MKKLVCRPAETMCAAVLIVVCCGGELYGLAPFGAPMFCALEPFVFFGFLAPVYVGCAFLFSFELWRLYAAGAVCFIAAVKKLVSLRLPKMNGRASEISFSLIAIAAQAGISALFIPVADAALTCFLASLFYYFARPVAAAASARFAFKLSVVDRAAVCVTLFVIGLCFGRAVAGGYRIGLALAYTVALFLCVTGVKQLLSGAISLALGMSLWYGVNVCLAFIGSAAVIAAFRDMPRIVHAVAGIGVFAALCVLFSDSLTVIAKNTLMLACGAAPFCILPRRAIKAIRSYFDFDGSARLALRHYINKTRADAGNKMLVLSSVFDEIARLMNGMRPPLPDYNALGRTLSERFCPYCPNNGYCEGSESAFTKLAELACEGRPILTELPQFFSSSCARTSEVVNAASELGEKAKERARTEESDRRAKGTVVERLCAVKDVLADLGEEQSSPVGFDGELEDRIAAELALFGVECAAVFVMRENVTAIVRTAAADEDKVRRAVSACIKRPCEVSIEKTQAAGWSVACVRPGPKYEAVYARAGVSKSGGVSGDSYTFERIGDKFLVALADGMGAGEAAGESSAAAVDLIECFYRAGFDSRSALDGANRFLKLPGTESYSAADIAVCDLDNGRLDIIKLGAPPCYIKTTDTVLKISGSSLPIGVLDEMKPFVTSKKLYPGQMLILATDGVSDCFSGDELPELINGLTALNPERTAEEIVRRALVRVGSCPRDDMTVIAFRLYEKKRRAQRGSCRRGYTR